MYVRGAAKPAAGFVESTDTGPVFVTWAAGLPPLNTVSGR